MDSNSLVISGHALVRALDKSALSPRLAMWVHSPDIDIWKLWLVPPEGQFRGQESRRDFYVRVAKVIAQEGDALSDIDASDIEMLLDNHPVVEGLRKFIRQPGLGSTHFSGNSFNGFYLPDGIILRCDF